MLSPLGAIKYNNIANTSQKVEVWLELDYDIFNNASISLEFMQNVFSIVNATNAVHSGTKTTVMMPQTVLFSNNNNFFTDFKRMSQTRI